MCIVCPWHRHQIMLLKGKACTSPLILNIPEDGKGSPRGLNSGRMKCRWSATTSMSEYLRSSKDRLSLTTILLTVIEYSERTMLFLIIHQTHLVYHFIPEELEWNLKNTTIDSLFIRIYIIQEDAEMITAFCISLILNFIVRCFFWDVCVWWFYGMHVQSIMAIVQYSIISMIQCEWTCIISNLWFSILWVLCWVKNL